MASVGGVMTEILDSDTPSSDCAVSPIVDRGAELANLGLEVEEGAVSGDFLFNIIDRRSGVVLLKLTCEEFFRLSARQRYAH